MQTTETVGFPLSPQQERILSLNSSQQVFPYVTQLKLSIKGMVDQGRLEKAVAMVVAKHETLRTRFVPHPALRTLLQVIVPEGSFSAETAQLPPEGAHNGLDVAHSGGPFNLSEGGLLRCVLAHFPPENSVCYLTLPSICADAATMKIIARDLAAAYENPDSSLLESAEIQYADVAEHFNALLRSDLGSMGKQYWHPRLTSAQAPLPQSDGAGTEMSRRFSPRVVHGRIDAEILAKAAGALGSNFSEEIFLLTCWQVLLAQLSGLSEFVVGYAAGGRDMPELEACAGPFERYLPLASEAGSNLSFAEFLGKTGATLNECLQWQNSFQWPEQESYHPVCFSFYDTKWAFAAGDVTFSCACLNSCTDRFQVKLSCARSKDAIVLDLFYDPSIYSEESARQIVEQFHTLTQSAGLAPQQCISEINAVSPQERQRLIRQFSSSDAILEFEDVVARFEQQAGRDPESTALVCNQERLSYGELNQRANQLAHYLAQLGVGPETRIAICMERSAEMVVVLLGVLKAGGAYVPLDPAHPSERMAYMLKDAGLTLVLTEEHLAQRLPQEGAKIVLLDREWNAIASHSSSNPPATVAEQNLAYVIYTSGSTGRPKGVAVTRKGLANYVNWACCAYEFQTGSCSPLYSSIGFDLTVTSLWPCLVAGGSVVVASESQGIDAIAKLAAENQPYDVLKITPAHLEMLKSVPPETKTGISRRFVIGGEALSWNVLSYWRKHAPGTRLINEYGPTETVVGSCIYEVQDEDGASEGRVPVGRPIASTQVYVLNQNGELCATGASGELYIGGAGVARGYLNHPELTAERFIPDSFSRRPGERLYRTGDLARWRADGQLIFMGRLDDQVKIRGYRIELGEIEATLRAHATVEQAAVVVREKEGGEKWLVGYVVLRASGESGEDREGGVGGDLGEKDLRAYLRGRLPEYMVPAVVVELDVMPLTANGKVDRKALPEPQREKSQEQSSPRTPDEEILCGIFAELLKLERVGVGVNDNFFELGGHSLLATQVISRVLSAFGVEIPLRVLFDGPTVGELAKRLHDVRRADQIAMPALVHVEREGGAPLSFAQQRLWFLQQLEPESVAYNMPWGIRLSGDLNQQALSKSLNEVVRRHEVLRTHFVSKDGLPVQVISAEVDSRVEIVDLSMVDEMERQAEALVLTQQEAKRPFDLGSGPLIRVKLLRLAEQEYVLLVTMHHIVTDGWSCGIMVKEFIELYRAYVRGEQSPLPELKVQYADFAIWQREWLQGEVLEKEVGYWREQLGGLQLLELPTDYPRPALLSQEGRRVSFEFNYELTTGLKRISRGADATLFMTLLAGFQALLARYSGQKDISVGTPIANRTRKETEELIGFFVNTLVLRTDLGGDPSFRHLLERVKKVAMGAYTHQDVPFEKLVEELEPERDLSRSSLFQVMLVLQNLPEVKVELGGLRLSSLAINTETSKFDLTVTFAESLGRLEGSCTYCRDLFDNATIERLIRHWENLMKAAVADSEQAVSGLSLLRESERKELVEEWNHTTVVYATGCIHELFERQAQRNPEAIAVECNGERLSYGELNRRANQLGHYLRKVGVGPEVRVGLHMERSAAMVVGLLGIAKAGGAYVPLDAEHPQDRLAAMVEDAGARAVLSDSAESLQWEHRGVRLICLEAEWSSIERESEENICSGVEPENLAYVLYTSGSTGRPKGVCVEHRQLVNYVQGILERIGPGKPSFAMVQPLAVDSSVTSLFGSLGAGQCVYIVPREQALDSVHMAKLLQQPGVEGLKIAPSHLAALQSGGQEEVMPRGLLIIGGEASRFQWARSLQKIAPECAIFNHYGPTETTVGVTTYRVESIAEEIGAANTPLGKPLPNTQVYVLDERMEPVPVGVAGELYIGGENVTRGYLNRADLTAEKFVPDPFRRQEGKRLYRTGDRTRYLASGDVEFLGREDDQVKLRGYRVELGEIEAALVSHAGVSQAVVIIRGKEGASQRLVAYVVAEPGNLLNFKELRDYLGTKVPRYMVPSDFVESEELPRTAHGKLDRSRLPEPERDVHGLREYEAPAGEIERLLADIWMELLKVERVGRQDNFFELGGHSLLGIQVISRVRSVFGVEMPMRALFEEPTVAGLAKRVKEKRRERGGRGNEMPGLEREKRGGDLPLSYAQQRLWFLDQMQPGSAVYNLPYGVRLEGELDWAALEMSFNELVRRHEALRTSFGVKDGTPVQVIVEEMKVKVEEVDLRGLEGEEKERESRRVVEEEAGRGFDLRCGPLMRVKVVRIGEKEQVLMVNMHHIVSDGWSMGIMMREFSQLYGGYVKGEEVRLAELPVQYSDYAVWQRRWLQGEVLEEQLGYWRQQLVGAPVLELPADHPRPPVMSYLGGTVPLALSVELTQQLKKVSQQAHVTLFMSLQTAFLTMLAKYAGQEDVSVGTAVANRGLIEIEGVIGFFVNTVVLRNDLNGNPSFRELLGRVRKTVLEAHEHQHLPFERLVEELQPNRDLSRTPLFQVMLLMHDLPDGELQLAGLRVSDFPFATNLTKVDLTLDVGESSAGITGILSYARDLYERKTVDRMAAQLRAIVEIMVMNPDQPIGDLALLTQAERQQVLVDWNRTRMEYPQKTVHELFEEQAEATPQNVAVVCEDRQLTFAQLNRQANQLAHHLRRLGATRGALVGLCVERSLEMMVGLQGILKSGAAYVPLEPSYPVERLQFMMQDSMIGILLTQERLLGIVPEGSTKVVCLDVDWEQIGVESEENPAITLNVEDLAYVIYTSGSTGKPKGVGIAHRNVVNFFEGMDQSIGCGAQDTLLAVTGISFDISVLELLWPLTRGAKVVLVVDPLSSAPAPARMAAAAKVDYSLFYFSSVDEQQTRDKYRLLLEGAKYADRNGLAAVWTPERHFHPFGGLYPNPSVTSAAVAAVTERIAVRAGSVVLPLHNVIRVAEEWSVVDNISGGRVGLAFASGWHSDDFALAPESYHGRRDAMFRSIETFLRLWRGESVKVRNGTGNEIEVHLYPRPIQEHPPLWITAAGSPETVVRAGKMGAHLLTHLLGQTIEEVSEKIRAYRAARAEGGYDPETGQVALMLHTFIGDDREKVREMVRGPFTEYLKSSVDLLRNVARGMEIPADLKEVSAEDMKDLLAQAFDRYFETSALFGTVKSCAATIERLQEIGVNEVACLIDFGVPDDAALGSLEKIGWLKKTFVRHSAIHPKSVGSLAMQHKPTLMQFTPAMMRVLRETTEGWSALKCLRTLMLGGESLPLALAQEIKSALSCKLVNMYGPTETTVWSSTAEVARGTRAVSVGKPIANTEFYIVDRHGQPVPLGSVGELWIGGDGIARGYLNRPELTAERFVPDAFSGHSGSRLYRTGDLARYWEDGRVELLGRNDAQVKIRGYRIELGEIESLLGRHPAVKAAVVVAREDGTGGKHLVAYIVEQESGSINSADLRGYVKESLPEYMVPARFVMLAELPLTPNGKVDRRALPVAGKEEVDQTKAYVPPGTPVEEEMALIWADVLRVERVGIHDNFFELGGHSLTATLLISRIRGALQVDLPLRALFEEPTIAGLSKKIDEQGALAEFGDDSIATPAIQEELSLEQVLANLEPFPRQRLN